MESLMLHHLHTQLGADFGTVCGMECVMNYGDVAAEYQALRQTAGVLDLGFRSRLCVTGEDRVNFLHGQVTNHVKGLAVGQGCYATLVNNKARIQSDLNLYRLPDELLLDFEPGLTAKVKERLEQFIIAEDAEVLDVAPYYGHLSVQGPKAPAVAGTLAPDLPSDAFAFATVSHESGDIYVMNRARCGSLGFDLFVPVAALSEIHGSLARAAESLGGTCCGWTALEIARVEAGIPRYGQDMDETIMPPEAGLERLAIDYAKGCYIGQEVISRIRTFGQVAKTLRGLRLPDNLSALPSPGDELYLGERKVGHLTSVIHSPGCQANLALGYVRKETQEIGAELIVRSGVGDLPAKVISVPFEAMTR